MKDLTVIIPLHRIDDIVIDCLNRCTDSIVKQVNKPSVVKIVLPSTIYNENETFFNDIVKLFKKSKITCDLISHDESTKLQHQINLGVKEIKTKWFSTIEFDDAYYDRWFDNVEKYIDNKVENISLFLPIVYNLNTQGDFINLNNELIWSVSLTNDSEALGFIDSDVLETFNDYQVMGGVFNTKDFIEVGGLKENIELCYWNELMLRLANNDKLIYVIPKFGYAHLVGLKDSFYDMINHTFSNEDIKFWVDKIKEEYLYNNDREITK